MDLSHSGMFEKVKDNFHTSNRGGYRQWFNPVYADPNKNTRLRPTKTNAMLFAEDGDEEDLVPRDDDDDEEHEAANTNAKAKSDHESHEANGNVPGVDSNHDNPIDPMLRTVGPRASSSAPPRAPSRAPSRAPTAMPEKRLRSIGEIQVLDLHSDNPIISYKGRIFSGNWASNIGTELVFGAHDEVADRGLPYLRTLPGGVDLMAASSARILTIPADLRPKKLRSGSRSGTPSGAGASATQSAFWHQVQPFQNRRTQPDRYRSLRREAGIEIPIAHDKHGRRKPQARFLENLMAIKRRRGEMDEATTMTKDTSRDLVDPEVDPEEASLQKKRARDRKRQARQKIERANAPKKKRRGGNRWNKPKITFADRRPPNEEGNTRGDGVEGVLSTRTPTTWEELNAGGEDGNDAEDAIMESN